MMRFQAVFSTIHHLLLHDGIVDPRQVWTPLALPSTDLLQLVHTPDYVQRFCSGTLGEPR